MSDTASPQSKARKDGLRRFAGSAFVAIGVLLIVGGGYVLYARQAIRAGEPLPFEPFKYRIAEEMLVRAKYEFIDGASRAIGATEPVTLVLDERELNALLFGDAKHSERGLKARVRIEEGALRLERSEPTSDGEAWLNLTAVLSPQPAEATGVRAQLFTLVLIEGAVGDYTLGPLTRPLVEARINERFAAQCAGDPRLRKVTRLSIRDGRVTISYAAR